MTDQAVKIIHEEHGDKPWMMIVSWHPPHFPVTMRRKQTKLSSRGKRLSLRPNVQTGKGTGAVASPASIEKFHQGYYAHIRAIDREFARLLEALEQTGQADNTIVIFTSDECLQRIQHAGREQSRSERH